MKKLLLIPLLACLLAVPTAPAWAALVRDAVSQNVKDGTGTTLDLAHTATGTDTDGLLVVLCDVNTSGATTFSGMNWDQGGANTPLTQHATLDPTVAQRLDIWYLKNPSPGAKTIRVTTSSAQRTACHAITYTGVDQTTPLGTAVSHDLVSGTTLTVDVTSAAGNFVIGIAGWSAGVTQTPGADQSVIGTEQTSGAPNLEEIVSEEAGAATTTHSWTWSGALAAALLGVSVNAAAASGVLVSPALPSVIFQ